MAIRGTVVGFAALAGVLVAAALLSSWSSSVADVSAAPAAAQPTLHPETIDKYVDPLVIPPVMPPAGKGKQFTLYRIAARQFEQQVLPTGYPMTTVWGYGDANGPGPGKPGSTHNFPAFTVEARTNERVRVQWINGLVDQNRNYLPHLLPVDQTLHWANPPGLPGRDTRGTDPTPYEGPVPIVTHLHGAHVDAISDGYPEAWYLPHAKNIPAGHYTEGTHYGSVLPAPPGSAWFEYRNDQQPTTLWYHDHALGITRLNVYAGLAGFWLIRDDIEDGLNLPGPAPKLGDPPGTRYYEIPVVIQDRSFNEDGSLFYPDNRAFFEGLEPGQLQIPFIPDSAIGGPSDVSPIWNPEFFGNTMVVNGKTWPYLEVEQRTYRFRFLNGSNSRFLILKLDNGLPFYQIGADGGFLPDVQMLSELLMAPAERADVIVDFTSVPVETEIVVLNLGPDEPFGGGTPGIDFDPADPATTGQVMQFRVVAAGGPDTSTHPEDLELPAITPLGPADNTRQVSLNEEESQTVFVSEDGFGNVVLDPAGEPFGPIAAKLGTLNPDGTGNPLAWSDEITENPALYSTEVWEIYNFTEDAHPIHLHLVMFEVVEREDAQGNIRGPEPWETGFKDTVIAYPGEITRIKAKFDIEGLYVWHCHILEHEDNEMMRPYYVGPMP